MSTTLLDRSPIDLAGGYGENYCHVALADAEESAICGYRGPTNCEDVTLREELLAKTGPCPYCKRARCPTCAHIIEVWMRTREWEGTMTPMMERALRERRG